MKPVIFGLSGDRMTDEERAFFRDVDPAGYILFKRNIVDRTQLRALTDDLRGLSGRDDLAILIVFIILLGFSCFILGFRVTFLNVVVI